MRVLFSRFLAEEPDIVLGRKERDRLFALVAAEVIAAQKTSHLSRNVPGGTVDRIHFSITSLSVVQPGTPFVINFWAYVAQERPAMLKRARESAGKSQIKIQSKGPVQVSRGTLLIVRLKVKGLIIDDPEDAILWDGDIGNATFMAQVPDDASPGAQGGLATIYANGLQIAKLHFVIEVGNTVSNVDYLPITGQRYQKAFASYASADRDQVLPRIQGIQKALPQLQIFLDVMSLRSGQYWEQELWKTIPDNDVFYLFWSENAKQSEWVEKEWRCALQSRGLDFIDPVPLAPPDQVPPPPELASKHFNDWVLAFMRNTQ